MTRGRLPGAVIGQVFRPGTGTPRDFPRYAGVIAKGLDIKLFRDAQVIRCDVDGEVLPFSGVTYVAPLANNAIPDKARSRLYTDDGRTVPAGRWNFTEASPGSNVYDQISIDPTIFSSTSTYMLDYVSNDSTLVDTLPIDELREVLAVGDGQGQVKYREGTDFYFPTTVTGPNADAANAYEDTRGVSAITTHPDNTVSGDNIGPANSSMVFNSSAYNHDYNRHYVLEVTTMGGTAGSFTATIVVSVYPTSGGTAAGLPRSATLLNQVTLSLAEVTPSTVTNVAIEHGVTLDFDFGGTNNFQTGDIYTFNGRGLGLLELDDKMLNTNQFPETSAVSLVSVAGDGTLTVNPQSLFTGSENQTYEIEVVASNSPTASPGRTASFRWRSNPKLLKLTGTMTATNSSAAVVGVGTAFLSEVSVGDLVFFGASATTVEVLSIASNTSLTLTAPFTFATVTGGTALRYRQQTGTFAITETTNTRVLMDSGIYLDLEFGIGTPSDNFTAGDTFSFEARPARVLYNGKENRSYDFSVTSVATPHQATMTFAGSTAASTFGSIAFSEGNPLVLPNNVVIHARNTSLTQRFVASPADTFDVALTVDGTINWNLSTEVTETISTSDILRDLTGSVTGTVGAYFILLRKPPTEVVYVRGPSPTFSDITYNAVSSTTIIWFTTNPGVTLTIKYRHAGIEPSPGATYFMTGYAKRPDTDYTSPQLFFTRDAARDFLAPMTATNDVAIANEVAWDQDEESLPGVVVCLVRDSDSDGVFTTADYENAIRVSQDFKGTTDFVTVNQFNAREEFRDSVVGMNDPTVARRRIGIFGFPTNYPIGDEFTSGSRVYVARRELQVYEESVARGSLVVIGNSYGKKTILVDSLGDGDVDSIPTQVTLDGSFLAVALAARVASFNEPWEVIYNLPISGFDEIEPLTETQMITLQDAGIICLRVEGGSAFYIGTMTTDETEASTQQLSGTVQRQYVLSRLQDAVNRRVVGFVADSPEEAAQHLQSEIVAELGAMVAEGKIGKYVDPESGATRALDPAKDVVAFRDRRDPTKAYFRASWYQKYPILEVDGIVAVDGPTP